MKTILLETSSYLPLIWRTPYSKSVVAMMTDQGEEARFLLQRDSVHEAAGYLSFEDDWRYHPSVRFRRLAERLNDAELGQLPFPSTAVQLLLGGSIWPQAQYLNFVRHTAFFFIDLLDGVSFEKPRTGLLECARRIEERTAFFRELFSAHESASQISLPQEHILSYWGTWYLSPLPRPFTIELMDDPRPFDKVSDKLRDLYHYDCALAVDPPADIMLVANTGFMRNVKSNFSRTPCPVVCAEAISPAFFA